jgi:cytoskeletal protein RodZ
MTTIDFSQSLRRLTGDPLTGPTSGLPFEVFYSEDHWKRELTLAGLCEPLLLFTRARKAGEKASDEPTVMSEEEKLNRFALNLKVRDGGDVEMTARDMKTLKLAMTALPTEAYGLVAQALGLLKDE